MGRARKQKTRDRNKQDLPQTPRKDIVTDDQDLELAKELDKQYDLKSKPGFSPTEAMKEKDD
ncbi:YfhD family protein [Texcoconibacillus texcoconensis]|nr:YfhD family protein [Texcoconibacillus texcoconensis]